MPTDTSDMALHVEGWRWPGPGHASRSAPVVGALSHGYGYGVVAPTHAVARVPSELGPWHPGYSCGGTGGGPLNAFHSLLTGMRRETLA